MKKFKTYMLLMIVIIGFLTPVKASADIGPKPSVTIEVKGSKEENDIYITLLSKEKSTGPYSKQEHYDDPIDVKFSEFKDDDGYHYINYKRKLVDGKFNWNYFPPKDFKLLMYIPATDSYIISESPLKTFAFKSNYSVDIPYEISNKFGNTVFVKPVKSYRFGQEALGLILRMFATIGVEIAVAFLFGFKYRKQLKTITITNIFTQGILNVLLFIALYFYGGMMFILAYIILEILIIVLEAIIYMSKLKTVDEKPIGAFTIWFYSLLANVMSLIIGILITGYIPGMF